MKIDYSPAKNVRRYPFATNGPHASRLSVNLIGNFIPHRGPYTGGLLMLEFDCKTTTSTTLLEPVNSCRRSGQLVSLLLYDFNDLDSVSSKCERVYC